MLKIQKVTQMNITKRDNEIKLLGYETIYMYLLRKALLRKALYIVYNYTFENRIHTICVAVFNSFHSLRQNFSD